MKQAKYASCLDRGLARWKTDRRYILRLIIGIYFDGNNEVRRPFYFKRHIDINEAILTLPKVVNYID